MVATPEPAPHVPNEAEKLANRALELSRVAVAGHPRGSIRRIGLYVIALVAILFLASDGSGSVGHLIVGGIATIVLAILALSDDLA